MKLIISLLEFLAFLTVPAYIYGVCGAYEQGSINGAELISLTLLFIAVMIVNYLIRKGIAAVIRFLQSQNNSRPDVKLNHYQGDYSTFR